MRPAYIVGREHMLREIAPVHSDRCHTFAACSLLPGASRVAPAAG